MKQYNALQVERIQRYVNLKERKSGKHFSIKDRRELEKYWIAKYAHHFRRWYLNAQKIRITKRDGSSIVTVGKGDFRRKYHAYRDSVSSFECIT